MTDLWFLFAGFVLGLWILRAAANVLAVWGDRMDRRSKEGQEERRQRWRGKSRKGKLGYLALWLAAGVAFLTVTIWISVLFTKAAAPQLFQLATGYYPDEPIQPATVGMYLGLAILVMLMKAVFEFQIEGEPADRYATVREALRATISLDTFIEVAAGPVACLVSIVIGNMKTPVYDGILWNVAEYAGVFKSALTILAVVVILDGFETLRRWVTRPRAKMDVAYEQGKQASEIQPGNAPG